MKPPVAPAESLLLLLPLAVLVCCLVAGGPAARAEEEDAAQAAPRTLLVTGFGPFGGYETNPAWESIRNRDGQRIGRTTIRIARLDVVYDEAERQLGDAIEKYAPELVLCLGVAPGEFIRVETKARNRDACPAPDNAGVVRADDAIRADGPDSIPTALPVEALLTRLKGDGYEVRTSDDAGGYLCNHVFYRLMDGLAGKRPAGFVHVPSMGGPWTLERLERAVTAILEVLDAAEIPAPTAAD